jgi:hypothetical protein
MARLLYVVSGANLCCGQDGLEKFMEGKISKKKLVKGDIIAFLNNKQDKVKVLGILVDGDVKYSALGYYRSPHGKLLPESIQYIPEVFGGGTFDMQAAIKRGLIDLLGAPK